MRALVAFDRLAHTVVGRHRADHPMRARPEIEQVGDAPMVRDALERLGFEASLLPLEPSTAVGDLARLADHRPDVVFNLCDTLGGFGSLALLVPAALEAMRIPFTGASSAGLALSKRKQDVKAALVRAGLPTPRYQIVEDREAAAALEPALQLPVIVKPTGEHASIGIDAGAVCFDVGRVRARCVEVLERFGQAVLVEEYVGGREVYVSLLGDPARPLHLMAVDFPRLPAGYLPIRTFDQKWFVDPAAGGDSPLAASHRDPPIPVRKPAVPFEGTVRDIEEVCRRAFGLGGGRDWGRVDLRVDAGEVPLIIDVTPNTYLSSDSPCAESARAAGLDYSSLLGEIVACASRRGGGSRG